MNFNEEEVSDALGVTVILFDLHLKLMEAVKLVQSTTINQLEVDKMP